MLSIVTSTSWPLLACRRFLPAITPTTCTASASAVYSPTKKLKSRQEVSKAARERFTQEISFQSKDKDISLSKALLYIAAEDEAYIASNREIDSLSFHHERSNVEAPSDTQEWDCLDAMPLAGKTIFEWLSELDAIVKEVRVELVSRDIGCDFAQVLESVNAVLFDSRGFTRPSSVLLDSKYSYLHLVLNYGCGSGILLSVIYIEICRRLGLAIVGSCVGEEFLIWPQNEDHKELFRVTSGHSLFAVVNGSCVEDPRSMASDLNSNSLLSLDIASNRDIIGIALANLMRLHWKRASRMSHGLMLTSPLRPVHDPDQKPSVNSSNIPLLRPQDLRLAIMASERLLILQPHNWALRRDHGMMLYYKRDYGEAIQELSICMAFAPEEQAEVLEPFVDKLHLLRVESAWKSLGHKGQFAVP